MPKWILYYIESVLLYNRGITMSEITKLYENANIKPEYRYDCNLADTIKPVEVFPLRSCSKGEIKDYCTNKQDLKYCKVYKVNKIYPPFTTEKQLSIVKFLLGKSVYYDTDGDREYWFHISDEIENSRYREFDEAIAECINKMWEDLRDYEKVQIKEILE